MSFKTMKSKHFNQLPGQPKIAMVWIPDKTGKKDEHFGLPMGTTHYFPYKEIPQKTKV